jgi:hypothetical protein
MDRARVAAAVIGGVLFWVCSPGVGRAGVWLTLAAGAPGGTVATDATDFWFDTPHGPPPVAIQELTGGVTAQAGTAGGSTFFGGAGTPVLLNVSDGSAYIASGGPPADTLTPRRPGGGSGGPLSSSAPQAGAAVPPNAALLGITLSEPTADGGRRLTIQLADPTGGLLGTGAVTVPPGGWWVIGLVPGEGSDPGPGDDGDGGPIDPPPPPPPSDGSGGPVATPEPSTLVLFALGGLSAGAWRRARSRSGFHRSHRPAR